MPKDKSESHARILAAAREEFMEYGFEKASMRRLGERVGMTAAGLYRHCKDKEDLFGELVAPAIDRMYVWMEAHIARNMTASDNGTVDIFKDSEVDMMREIIYPNMEEYRLLLTKAQGTRYENFLQDFVDIHQKKMIYYFPIIREKGIPVRDIDEKELRMLLSAYTTALFEPVYQGYTYEEALRCLDTVEMFFLPGWKILFGIEEN